jgi:hypothetical protein
MDDELTTSMSGRCGERERKKESVVYFYFYFVFRYCSRELNTLLHQEVGKDPSALSFVRPTTGSRQSVLFSFAFL